MARFSENALVILRERYLCHDEIGHTLEIPTAMLERVARAAAAPAREFGEDPAYWEERFYRRLGNACAQPSMTQWCFSTI